MFPASEKVVSQKYLSKSLKGNWIAINHGVVRVVYVQTNPPNITQQIHPLGTGADSTSEQTLWLSFELFQPLSPFNLNHIMNWWWNYHKLVVAYPIVWPITNNRPQQQTIKSVWAHPILNSGRLWPVSIWPYLSPTKKTYKVRWRSLIRGQS